MSSIRTTTLEAVRTLVVYKQGLHARPTRANREALLNSVRRIGLLQLDSVSVVAQSHYLTMLARVGNYSQSELDALLNPDRMLFEQWAHAACLIPREDYPYLAPSIYARRDKEQRWFTQELAGTDQEKLLEDVLLQVEMHGPLTTRHFETQRSKPGGWWNYSPPKHALTLLLHLGHLHVVRRDRFQIVYDIAERVLPEVAQPPDRTVDEYEKWATLKGLRHLGIGPAGHICDYYRLKKTVVQQHLRGLEHEGEVVPIRVEGWKENSWVATSDLELLAEIESGAHRSNVTAFLSPFDNSTWNRSRLDALFGFDYELMLYIPKARRKYGYYVMPIFHRGTFIGRIDPKLDRKSRTLILQNVAMEPGPELNANLVASLANCTAEFAAFHGADSVSIGACDPPEFGEQLMNALAKQEVRVQRWNFVT